MYMWDVPGANMSFFSGHSATVSCGGWAPDGRNFLSGGDDAALVLWSPKTGSVINKLHGSTFNLSHDTGKSCRASTPHPAPTPHPTPRTPHATRHTPCHEPAPRPRLHPIRTLGTAHGGGWVAAGLV